mgnify:CR=1 FL=1
MATTTLAGVALAAGADLGGQRAVLLMQSSGVGNCINLLSLIVGCRFPLLTIVSMLGDFGEGNPWQFAMGQAVEPVLKAMGDTFIHLGPLSHGHTSKLISNVLSYGTVALVNEALMLATRHGVGIGAIAAAWVLAQSAVAAVIEHHRLYAGSRR